MHIASMLVVGLVIGVLAKLVTPAKGSALVAVLAAVAGAVVAGLLGHTVGWFCAAAGWYGANESASVVASFVGAIMMVRGYRRIA